MNLNLNELLQKPIAMMRGEELAYLLEQILSAKEEKSSPIIMEERYVYGISGIAKMFGCSVPTANRIKKSGVIDKAITQIGRKIVVNVEEAIRLVNESGAMKLKPQPAYRYE